MAVPAFPGLTDEGLVAAARSGWDEAWVELLRRHHPPLLRYLTAAVGDPEEAAQLAQDTYLDAFRALDGLAPGRPLAPWLYQIARNNLLPYWRRRARLRFTSLDPTAEWCRAPLGVPDDLADRAAEQDVLRHVLGELSPLLREALLLHALAGLSAPEVAATVGIAPKAAEQRIGRAKALFRARYKALSGGEAAEPWSSNVGHQAPDRRRASGVGRRVTG
jgi:RNA polymerase sigma factor (sigma-70 family)